MFPFLNKKRGGFSLVETIVGVAVFSIIAISVWQSFGAILNGVKYLRIKSAAINLANEQIEIIKNLPYDDVGIIQGLPNGKIPREQILSRNSKDFLVTTTIRNIDDPFDGQIGGSINDLSPADNKLVAIKVECKDDCGVPAIILTTRVSPIALETVGNNGALFVQVFDSSGQPLAGADVYIENNIDNIIVDDITNTNGMLQIVDAPPRTEAYEITVTKDGYSTERTYANGDPENPVPDKLHANVVTGQVTQVSFAIDELSEININSRRSTCSNVGNFDFNIKGSKTIGLNTYKYDEDLMTNGSGNLNLEEIEWDSYIFNSIDPSYFLAGSNPILPLDLAPGSIQSIDLIVTPRDPNALLIKVVDSGSNLPLADAVVSLSVGSDDYEMITGKGAVSQDDWSGGAGQNDFSNETQYLSDDGHIEINNPAGEIGLVNFGGGYVSFGQLISSTFDVGTTTNFDILEWLPGSQPVETGTESARFQVATSLDNTATTTWEFVGPDGTTGSYFTNSGQSFSNVHNGDRYFRYKTLLSTENSSYSPSISQVSFSFSTECMPAGQAYFDGLSTGFYELNIEKNGYQKYTQSDVSVSNDWQEITVKLIPE